MHNISEEKKKYYKMFAFCILLKFNRDNSMLYSDESERKLSRDLNLNTRTFKKYYNACLNEGLIVKQGTHFNVIGYAKIIENWRNKFKEVDDSKSEFLFSFLQIFNCTTYKQKSFKDIYNQILDSIVIKNFKQQEFKIKETKQTLAIYKEGTLLGSKKKLNTHEQKKLKNFAKKANSLGFSADRYFECLSNADIYIKTGKDHTAKQIGMSSSTGTRILKRLQAQGKVYRETVMLHTNMPVNNAGFDYLKSLNKETTIVQSQGEFILSKGSRIDLNTEYMELFYSIPSLSKKIKSSTKFRKKELSF